MEKVSKFKQILYANGHGGFSILDNIFGIYFIFFLLPPKETGMPELINNKAFFIFTLTGIIIIFGRLIDSLADPLIAYWSDHSKSRFGRRRFFILTGAFPFALTAVLLFTLPDNYASGINAVYAAVMLGIYFFFYTYYVTPYLALLPEITYSHENRIFVTLLQAVFMLLGAAVVMMGVPVIWQKLQGLMSYKTNAFQVSIAVVAFIGFISMFSANFGLNKEKCEDQCEEDISVIESIKLTMKNKAFIVYLIPVITYWFAFHMVRSTIAYYPIVLLKKDASFQTILTVILFGGAAVFFGVISLLSKRITNKTFMLGGLLSFSIILIITYFIDLLLPYKIGGTSLALIVACVQMFLLGLPVAILLVIPNAIVADISEVDGYEKGIRREAMFFGAQGLFMKLNYGIAAAIITGLFSVFGKDASAPMGVKLSGPAASIFAIVGFFILLKFPQKEILEKLKEIRKQKL